MKKLEQLKLKPTAQWQAERLARWLHEWQLQQTLAQAAPEPLSGKQAPSNSTDEFPAVEQAPPDMPPAPGQIRLLRPRPEAPDDGPLFVATLAADTDDVLTGIPFSPFSEPATPDELLTGRPQSVVRVLCLWNARTMRPSELKESWLVDDLTDQELTDFTHALRTVLQTDALPDDMQQLGGPPLVHPDDPRHIYLSMERTRINVTLPESTQATAPSVLRYPESGDRARDDLPLAAEDSEDYTSE